MITKEQVDKARAKSIEIFQGEHGKDAKADFVICNKIKLSSSKKTKCFECGTIIYYDKKLFPIWNNINCKVICLDCAYNNHRESMTELEREIIYSRIKQHQEINK